MGCLQYLLLSFAFIVAVVAIVIPTFIIYIDSIPNPNQKRCFRMAEAQEDNKAAFKEKKLGAFILGGTGEVGKEMVKEALQSQLFSRVVLIGRREVKYEGDLYKDVEQKVIDFDKVEEHQDAFQDLEVGFCALGTTRGKSGKDGFVKVDYDYVLNSAKVAKAAGCKDFHLVTSQGSNKNSSFLYPKTKGLVEEAVTGLEFDRLSIYRPGLLMCEREESRPFEKVMRVLAKPMAAAFPGSGTTSTNAVARAMLNVAVAPHGKKMEIFESKAILQIAGDIKK